LSSPNEGDAITIGSTALAFANVTALMAPLASPQFTGSPTAPTAAQFNDSTLLASTAFVQRALGNFRDVVGSTSATTVALTQAQVGMLIYLSAVATVTQAVTLPSGTGLPVGATFTIARTTFEGLATVTPASGQQIDGGNGIVSSVTLRGGDTAVLVWNGVLWAMSGPAMQRIAGFHNQIAASGWQRLPSGLIMQWGTMANSGSGARQIDVTLPVAFPTAHLRSLAVDSGAGCFPLGATPLSTTQIRVFVPSHFLAPPSGTVTATTAISANWLAFGH
jgi:hypothetical protein